MACAEDEVGEHRQVPTVAACRTALVREDGWSDSEHSDGGEAGVSGRDNVGFTKGALGGWRT